MQPQFSHRTEFHPPRGRRRPCRNSQRLAHPETASSHKRSASAPRACSLWPQENFPQDQIIYENGPANGTTDAWAINFGYVVSDSFTGGNATGFDFYAWEFPGDVVTAVDWSITSAPNRGTVYGSGTANVVDTFVSTNQFGYDIDHISVTGLNVNANRAVWLNL